MYTAQILKKRIKEQQKKNNIKNSDEMMNELGLGVNIIRQMSDNKGVGCFALAKIADRLDCSVDYLLGRTNSPNSTYTISNENTTINGTQANVINNSIDAADSLTKQFLTVFDKLPFEQKVKVINYVTKIKTSPDIGEE